MNTLCFDIGGTGIKAMLFDGSGRAISARVRVPTPRPGKPGAVLGVVRRIAKQLPDFERVSVSFPGVVRRGVIFTAANLHPTWHGYALEKVLERELGHPVRVANDADTQGLAVVKGKGVELILTLGTGIGSGLFFNGALIPNLELGHHPFRHDLSYEDLLGEAALERDGKKHWNRHLREALRVIQPIFNPERIYLGGGNARKVSFKLPKHVEAVSNDSGLIGGLRYWDRPMIDDLARPGAAGRHHAARLSLAA